jgi:hypothetical protein
MQGIEPVRISHRVRQPFCNRAAGCTAHRRSVVGHEQTNRARRCRVCLCSVNRLQSQRDDPLSQVADRFGASSKVSRVTRPSG